MSDLEQVRQDKLQKVKDMGHDVYPQPNLVSKNVCSDVDSFLDKSVTIAGRLMLLRGHGKILFADLHDRTGKTQLFFEQNTLGDKMALAKLFDLGDIISATGTVFKTQSGETTIRVSDFQLLAKCLRPLPEKWHGLTDTEERYRMRYLDLIVNPESRKVFLTRTKILSTMRQFLDDNGFLEVETPILQPVYGGASAKPFVTHHNELDQDMYLRISDELYLKRLIVGGFEKVYEVSRDFRNESVSRFHNPEFTQIEFYWAYVDYDQLMKFTEELVAHVIKTVNGNLTVKFQDQELDFTPPFKRLTFRDAIFEKLSVDIDQIKSEDEFKKELADKKLKLDLSGVVGLGAHFDALYKEYVRPFLVGPVYITDYPAEMIALAKRKADNPEKIASFQLLAAGAELLKAYNELNDPKDQHDRWLDEVALEKKGAENAMQMDDDYIRALEFGMPPTAGWGMGIDRFTQFITNSPTIKDVILFPSMRDDSPKKTKVDLSKIKATDNTSSLPDENSKRFIAVLNEKIPVNKLANALGHMTAGLSANYSDIKELCFLQYQDKDGNTHPNISHFPYIVLSAENSNQIRKAKNMAIEQGIPFTDFTSTMTIGTSQAQLDATKTSKEIDLEYYGVCFFGSTDELKEITKKFSLYKGSSIKDTQLLETTSIVNKNTEVGLASDKVIIGEITELNDHPNADKLHVLKVNLGTETLQIVCGATNIKVGDIVPVSLIGAQVFGDDMVPWQVGPSKLRGVESNGMLCSTRELGLGPDHDGIYLLDQRLKEFVGQSVNKHFTK